MSQNVCPQCGAPIELGATECKFCGEKLAVAQANVQMQQPAPAPAPAPNYAQQPQPAYSTAINPAWPIKSKIVAGILAILLGSLGVHKFYLGKIGMGIVYLLFCWTGIPGFIGFIEGIIYLCSNDENFMLKHHVRIG